MSAIQRRSTLRRAVASGVTPRVEVRLTVTSGLLDVLVLDVQGDQGFDEDHEVSLRLLQGLAPVVAITATSVHLAWGADATV